MLVSETCRTATPAQLQSVAMLLAHLANSQEHLPALPAKAFKHLAKVRVHVMCQGGPIGCVIGSIVTEFS